MVAASVGARGVPAIGSGRLHAQALVGEPILDAERQTERVAGPRMQHVLHHDPVLRALGGDPGGPADEPVDGVLLLEVVDRELVVLSVEAVAAILDSVGPRDEDLSTP